MGTIKDRNSKDLTKKQKRFKRGGKNTQRNYTKKILMTWTAYDGVNILLEPDILECEVKWALGSITMNKASGGDGIPGELFQILKDDGLKVLRSICQQIWKTQQWPQHWKRLVFIPIKRKAIPKKGQPIKQLSSSHLLARYSSKSFKLSFNSTWTENFQMYKLVWGTRDQIVIMHWIIEKAREFQKKHLHLLHWLC